VTTTHRCLNCDGLLTEVDSEALAAHYRSIIDAEHAARRRVLLNSLDDELALHSFLETIRGDMTPDQAEALADWWDFRMTPGTDGDTHKIAEAYRLKAEYLRRYPAYDPKLEAQQLVGDFWQAIDPDGLGRAQLEAWREFTGVDVDQLAAACMTEQATAETRTAA
jgi:hypothetical protein